MGIGVRPTIQSVTFSGTHGAGQESPTITITGTNFGSTAPAGTSNNTTACGPYTANGKVFESKLYFEDDTNFEAGSSNTAGADCVGIVVVSASTRVVLKFGNPYGSFDHWYLTNGDGYALSLKAALWGGQGQRPQLVVTSARRGSSLNDELRLAAWSGASELDVQARTEPTRSMA